MKNDFEDIFKNLKNAEISPSDHLWNKINGELKFEETVNELKNYNALPKDNLWHKIRMKLIFYNFFSFSFKTFNAYYLSLLLLLSAIVWLNNNQEKAINKNTKTFAQVDKKDILKKENKKLKDEKLKRNTLKKKETYNNVVTSNSNQNLKNKKENILVAEREKTSIIEPKRKIKVKKIVSVVDIDTFIVYDTIRYFDTIKVLQPHNLELEKFNKRAIGFCVSTGFLSSNLEPTSNNFVELAQENRNATKSLGTYNITFFTGFNLKKGLSFVSGIGFSQYFEAFEYVQHKQVIDTSYLYKFFNTTYYVYNQYNYIKYDTISCTYSLVMAADSSVDTVWRYDIDTIVLNIIDSTLITEKDSDLVMIVDTNKETHFYNYINKYSYLQLPLFLAYSFDLNKKFAFNVKGGVIANIFINAKGYGISFNDTYEVVEFDKLPFLKLFFNFYASTGIDYKLDNRASLCLDLYYSTSNNIFDKNYFYRKKFYSTGIKFGFKYGF